MASPPDYRALWLQSQEALGRAEEERRQAQEERRQAEDERDRERERTRDTTFLEFLGLCHNIFSVSLRVGSPARSTKGTINPPIGKSCPVQFLPWEDCDAQQQKIHSSVCMYLQPQGEPAPRLFASRHALDHLGQVFSNRALSSEKDLEGYERFGVENHVYKIISELCKIPGARAEFELGDGVWFDNHDNDLDVTGDNVAQKSDIYPSRPDQFCIHRVNGETSHIVTTVEYKPPHKLSVENLRSGLKPIRFWDEVVRSDSVPIDKDEKLKYNALVLTGSAIAQEYHVMLQEGLEYSYLTNGIALVLLRVPRDTPEIVYYRLCEPNLVIRPGINDHLQQPLTTIARVLCLCLMSFRAPVRDQAWRHFAKSRVPEWKTSFDHARSQIPDEELRENPPDSEYVSPESTGERTVSDYIPSSSSFEETAEQGQMETRSQTRSRAQCRPDTAQSNEPSDPNIDPDSGPSGRKRGFSELTTSSSSQSANQSPRQTTDTGQSEGGHYQHNAQFCTQKCLIGLKLGGKLDESCPNVALHRKTKDNDSHSIDAKTLVQLINQQLDKNLDIDCTPIGKCGTTGAPFKITCTEYGYTVVGKGTTTHLWGVVSREAEIYSFLKQAQGSAIPVFLGTIDLAMTYYLHGAGRIRHMLLMGWAGEHIDGENVDKVIKREVARSKKEIRCLGLLHGDLRWQNILWNAELNRALIIDFDSSQMDPRLLKKPPKQLKRKPSRLKGALSEKVNHGEVKNERKRLRVL
ncbi:hypothetical protein MGYG_03758 [Nannizzia gypsea CBS 118893]|uniref:Aminoglycoside phosphotransferase domain-containing protein n=1 Tax=Arthroderma gypseum (strain ATCC MYA-4604 / CBS 118893) TaxID=535722 RepID=E4UTP5_ARTGP|nr:hypothetical protein MGYG_03758 [Nannizzia gypsea CBS 118893]EFR00754.1 hypothetical protein MGYG_03758 [Nannizzia gypsea CBS 118893]